MFEGVSEYFANSIVNSALPWVAERSGVEKPNISASGTSASTRALPSSSVEPWTMPRRCMISDSIAPENSAGPSIESFMIGSRILGAARGKKSRNAPRAASWNAMSLESTACDWPSVSATRRLTTGTPRRGDFRIIDLKPFSHDGMNSRGIAPPLISSSNSKSPSNGSA